jgi:hypothetical protein
VIDGNAKTKSIFPIAAGVFDHFPIKLESIKYSQNLKVKIVCSFPWQSKFSF